MPIQSILNPYWNMFLKEEYSGSNIEADLSYATLSAPVPNSTISSGVNAFGNLIISSILSQYNFKNGTNYTPTDFGIVNLNNDQNSQCAYLVFPTSTSVNILFRVYLEVGNSFDIGFNIIKYYKSPIYSNPITRLPFYTTIQIVRCNLLMMPLALNLYNTNFSNIQISGPIKNFTKKVLGDLFCPIPYSTSLFDVVPETFTLDRYVPYTFDLEIGDGYPTSVSDSFALGNNLEFLSDYSYINDLIIGNDLSTSDSSVNGGIEDFIIGDDLSTADSTTNGAIEDFSIGDGVSASSSETTTSFAIGDDTPSTTTTSTTSFTIGTTS